MKNTLSLVIISLLFVFNIACSQPQSKEENQIISMLKEFYIAYNDVWEKATTYKPKEFEKKVFILQNKYCSRKLQSEINKYYKIYKFEHDLITNDYGGTDSEKLKSTLSITKDVTKNNSYIVSYMVEIKESSNSREEKNVIRLTVAKEDGSYKIDKIW